MKTYFDLLPSEHYHIIYRLQHEMNLINIKNELLLQIIYVRNTLKFLKISRNVYHPMLYSFKHFLLYYLHDIPMNYFYKKQFYKYIHSCYMESIRLELFFYYIKT